MAHVRKKDAVFLTELDTYLFGQGTHYEIYNKMGAHEAEKDGKREFTLQPGHQMLVIYLSWVTLITGMKRTSIG